MSIQQMIWTLSRYSQAAPSCRQYFLAVCSFLSSLTFSSLEEWETVFGDPERPEEIDLDLLLDLVPGLPVELSAHAHSGIVDQGIQAWKEKKH